MSNHEHYIIVKVIERPGVRATTDVGRIRQAVHDALQEHDMGVSTMVLHGDRNKDVLGRDITRDYTAVRGIFHETLAAFREKARRNEKARALLYDRRYMPSGNPVRTSAQKEKNQHHARARRALLVVLGYVEKYGDDLSGHTPNGRHAR
jgi:hypothetical protein